MKTLLERVLRGETLSEDDAEAMIDRIATTEIDPTLVAELLSALRARGETVDEVTGFARALRRRAFRPLLAGSERAADTCGTGGDGSGSLNLSTASALLACACGVPIIKHGNRSVSSRAGSADVIEALGIALFDDEHDIAARFAATRFAFLFAPRHHPTLAKVAPVRRALGGRTVFNLLGPLVSPVAPRMQVTGAYDLRAARVMASSLARLGVERAFVVHGAEGWDEATPIGPFTLVDVRGGVCVESIRDPQDLGLSRCTAAMLRGGDAQHNARRMKAVLEGGQRGPHRDAVLLGAALVLEVTGHASDAHEGVALAKQALDRGEAEHLLWKLRESPPHPGSRTKVDHVRA